MQQLVCKLTKLATLTTLLALTLPTLAQRAPSQPSATGAVPPKTWVDKDTGHRIVRVTDEPNSTGFYFNVNAYTPDLKTMIYTAPDGIHTYDLATHKTRLLVPNPPRPADDATQQFRFGGVHAIIAGRITNSVFYTEADPTTHVTAIYKADVYTGAITKLTDLPRGMSVATINADETLGAGTINDKQDAVEYGARRVNPPGMSGPLVQPANKGEMMEQRLAARTPLTLNTIDLKTGKLTVLFHSTDWIGHMLFSPKDPTLLMYCHEGPWQKVDRIWMIHTDGTHNTLIHKRRIAMEIAGHEFWGLDGETIWYDWQPIKGQDFYLAGYDLATGKRTAYHMERNEWSIHFNLTKDLDLFTGDGGDPGQVAKAPDGEWIELFHPHDIKIQRHPQRPRLLPARLLHLRAPGEYVAPRLQAGAQRPLLAGQVDGLLHQQHLRPQLRLRRRNRQGRQPRPSRHQVHARARRAVQPGHSA
jgi:oligogalacturonide lyase